MAWYYWVWIGTSIIAFLDLYSTLIRATPSQFFGDLFFKPILVALLSAIWPVFFVYMAWKQWQLRAKSK